MKIVKQLCLRRKISFLDMANLLDIPTPYAVLACANYAGFDKERLAIADFFDYITWDEMTQRNSRQTCSSSLMRINKATQILVGAEPQRTIIEQIKTTILYEYDGCWYVERVFFGRFGRQQFFNRGKAEDAFFSEEIRLLAWGITA